MLSPLNPDLLQRLMISCHQMGMSALCTPLVNFQKNCKQKVFSSLENSKFRNFPVLPIKRRCFALPGRCKAFPSHVPHPWLFPCHMYTCVVYTCPHVWVFTFQEILLEPLLIIICTSVQIIYISNKLAKLRRHASW